jgi:hypothetical protein
MPDFYSPSQRRAYMAQYRAKRMAWAHTRLGGVCATCGTTEHLEFDHIDPSTKVNEVTRMLHHSKAAFQAEVAKCQLLCKAHHIEKSNAEGSTRKRVAGPVRHGTTWAYDGRGCRCAACKEAKRLGRNPRAALA